MLMDYEMPGMDGPSAASAMRDLEYLGAIIGITGNSGKSYNDYFISNGANVVLVKPPDLRLLKTAILGKC